jgi:Na+/proline symporter
LVVASLAAAYMSTISTHLNWGASYIVQDFYRRFLVQDRDERHYVAVARAATVGLIILAMVVSLWLQNALQAFQILLQIGAGTGLIFLLRWFWWRVNAWSEISGMVVSFAVAVWFQFFHVRAGFAPIHPSAQLLIGVSVTTIAWLGVTMLTPPADRATLQEFYDRIRPMGRGWSGVVDTEATSADGSGVHESDVGAAMLGWVLGSLTVYATLFGTGYLLYGRELAAAIALGVAAMATIGLFRILPRIGFE